MRETHDPPSSTTPDNAEEQEEGQDDQDDLRILSRSPHPYHKLKSELLDPADRIVYSAAGTTSQRVRPRSLAPGESSPAFSKDSTPASDTGTEADDEHFLKRLPAPRAKLHKGLRGRNESLSGTSTPALSPLVLFEDAVLSKVLPPGAGHDGSEKDQRSLAERVRRRKEMIRRLTELFLLGCQGALVWSNEEARKYIILYCRELLALGATLVSLGALYPLRVLIWAYRKRKPAKKVPLAIPASFDPAPIFYPPLIPIFVSLLTATSVRGAVLPNLILALCAVLRTVVPTAWSLETFTPMHWLLSCIPLLVADKYKAQTFSSTELPRELLVLLYPLHQTLCLILHYLTTTSLLTAELQLLSISLINVLLLASSPQALILKALLWGGGVSLTILCGQVVRWGISLARVPKWRFRRAPAASKRILTLASIWGMLTARRAKRDFLGGEMEDSTYESGNSSDENYHSQTSMACGPAAVLKGRRRGGSDAISLSPSPPLDGSDVRFNLVESMPTIRRNTLPTLTKLEHRHKTHTHTPSGRRKRSASFSVRAFFSLTQQQATMRKWLYAGYVYACIIGIILLGIRSYVQRFALHDNEPIGWALGYLFGDLPWFRLQVVANNLERWICLPTRTSPSDLPSPTCPLGLAQHLRLSSLGAANTRLILSAHCLLTITTGLAIVLQLSPVFEVDTRRKVFHFMMVAMFLPAIPVDPAFVALALELMLAIFLLLDLLRASQLPPLSKPIAAFLTPYVDGRDLRGPVVISHIFLLIGCAIPLWLGLAAVPRSGLAGGDEYWDGWEVPTRDVSMVAGVVCVGLGDAAASLIGRRWGHRKWLWGGGKSLEGSAAFAAAVFVGLMVSSAWLRLGGWPATGSLESSTSFAAATRRGLGLEIGDEGVWKWLVGFVSSWAATARKTGVCASLASLTEAVLTGGNDNVVVPVVLWTCVKGFEI